jgi:hypothetical protein
MKYWIPPVIVLAWAGVWIAIRQGQPEAPDARTGAPKERVGAAGESRGSGLSEGLSLAERQGGPGDGAAEDPAAGKRDLKALAESLARARADGAADMRELLRIKKVLVEMDPAELDRALTRIDGLGLDEATGGMLRDAVLGAFVEKAPELLLERHFKADMEPSDAGAWAFPDAFRKWVEKDPAASVAWLDQRIATGDFASGVSGGSDPMRGQFEGVLIGNLLALDPAAATRRIEGLPEAERVRVIQGGDFANLPEEAHAAFADLVRKCLPDERAGRSLAIPATVMVHQGGYARVTRYLEEIAATPEERAVIAGQVAPMGLRGPSSGGRVTTEGVAAMRGWLGDVAPDEADRLAGRVLGSLREVEPGARLEMLEGLLAGGGDDLVVGFVEGGDHASNLDEVRKLAESIEDPVKRAGALERLKLMDR